MTQIGEGISVPQPEPPAEKKKKKDKLKIRCSLFFDGTLNNRDNTAARQNNSEEYRENKGSKDKADGSYENDNTNVATLEYGIKDQANGYDEMIAIYTEGPGTVTHGDDEFIGYAFGGGDSGVKMKVTIGINDAVDKISYSEDGKREPEGYILEKLTLDVFGFSRGAAGARYCIYKLLNDDYIQQRLELSGLEVPDGAIEVCFAGLFDTVSSYWGGQVLHTDNWLLSLTSVKEAKKVVQLAAAEEHRKNFPLHNIRSAGGKGEQFYLPGVHSDVGGSYREGDGFGDENMVIFKGSQWQAQQDRKWLIERGWYKAEEITEEIIDYDEIGEPDYVQLMVKRSGIHNAYCLIPLKIMAGYAGESGISYKSGFIPEISGAINSINDLKKLEQKINSHIAAGSTNSTAEAWMDLRDSTYNAVRHTHLHFSAKYETGLKPRTGFFNGKRKRYEFDG